MCSSKKGNKNQSSGSTAPNRIDTIVWQFHFYGPHYVNAQPLFIFSSYRSKRVRPTFRYYSFLTTQFVTGSVHAAHLHRYILYINGCEVTCRTIFIRLILVDMSGGGVWSVQFAVWIVWWEMRARRVVSRRCALLCAHSLHWLMKMYGRVLARVINYVTF